MRQKKIYELLCCDWYIIKTALIENSCEIVSIITYHLNVKIIIKRVVTLIIYQ